MKKILLSIQILITMNSFAQQDSVLNVKARNYGKDTVLIHHVDTTYVPVYIIEKKDTVETPILFYTSKKNGHGKLKISQPGYLIRRGQIATKDGKQFEWLKEPEIIGSLDKKRRPVKAIINNGATPPKN